MSLPARRDDPNAHERGEILGNTIPGFFADLDRRRANGTLVASTGGVRRTVLLQGGPCVA